jgi:hypothetical protein
MKSLASHNSVSLRALLQGQLHNILFHKMNEKTAIFKIVQIVVVSTLSGTEYEEYPHYEGYETTS